MIQRLVIVIGLVFTMHVFAQDTLWDLNRCLSYAREKNISIQLQQLDRHSDAVALKKARASHMPDLRAGSNYSINASSGRDTDGAESGPGVSQSVGFSLSSGITLFDGFRTRNDIRQKQLQLYIDDASLQVTAQSIEIAVTQAYLQVLFAHESVKNAEDNLATTTKQLEYTRELRNVGSASLVELENMRSQSACDEYELIVARNSLDQGILELKQLLELSPTEPFKPYYPALHDSLELPALPEKDTLILQALQTLPQMQESKLEIDIAQKEKEKAAGGYFPSLSLSAGVSSNYSGRDSEDFSSQLSDNISSNAGLQLSIPIVDRKQTSSSVLQAEIAKQKAQLRYRQLEKSVLLDVEKAYQNCVASYKRYNAAMAQLKAAKISFDLAQQQYALGMLKPTDLLVQKDQFNKAREEFSQSKYSSILNYELLTVYQGKRITFPEQFSKKD